jgi:hypothetical protein
MNFPDNVNYKDKRAPWNEIDTEEVECPVCEGFGTFGHDCGEDVCPCLEPEENVICDVCAGKGKVELNEEDE